LTDPDNIAPGSSQKAVLKHGTFFGNEIVAGTRRLCLMNMFLHGIGEMTGAFLVSPADALISPPPQTFDSVLANPPVGKKSSRKLLQTTDLHTILRLPTGISYLHGVKTNMICFDSRAASPYGDLMGNRKERGIHAQDCPVAAALVTARPSSAAGAPRTEAVGQRSVT